MKCKHEIENCLVCVKCGNPVSKMDKNDDWEDYISFSDIFPKHFGMDRVLSYLIKFVDEINVKDEHYLNILKNNLQHTLDTYRQRDLDHSTYWGYERKNNES